MNEHHRAVNDNDLFPVRASTRWCPSAPSTSRQRWTPRFSAGCTLSQTRSWPRRWPLGDCRGPIPSRFLSRAGSWRTSQTGSLLTRPGGRCSSRTTTASTGSSSTGTSTSSSARTPSGTRRRTSLLVRRSRVRADARPKRRSASTMLVRFLVSDARGGLGPSLSVRYATVRWRVGRWSRLTRLLLVLRRRWRGSDLRERRGGVARCRRRKDVAPGVRRPIDAHAAAARPRGAAACPAARR